MKWTLTLVTATIAGVYGMREVLFVRPERRREEKRREAERPKQRALEWMDKLRVPYLHPFHVAAYVSRPAIERRIIDHVSKSTPSRYLVVVGSRGVGKSFLVWKLLNERRKVVYVKLSEELSIIAKVLRAKLAINEHEAFEMEDLFLPFAELRGTEKPVLVVEVEGTVDEAVVGRQSQVITSLCDDLGLAHGILILSNANAAAWLKQDASRQNFLWMGEFTPGQANQYLDNRGALLTDGDDVNAELRRQICEKVSTNARFLRLVADDATEDAAAARADAKEEGKSEAESDAAAREAERDATKKLIATWKETAATDLRYLVRREPNDDDPCQWRRPAMEEIVRALV